MRGVENWRDVGRRRGRGREGWTMVDTRIEARPGENQRDNGIDRGTFSHGLSLT